ncbi:MAG: GNAT family N-acetyltransferase [Bdellovibrionales bacterium]|nr:GNAT family N-acetyltransferase [Bdellovibrionales bacterium]
MKLTCRVLDQQEVTDLWRLTSLAQNDGRLQLWEDRADDFTRVYIHHCRGDVRYYGLFDGLRLVGCSGLVPTAISGVDPAVTTYLDTDLFIHPEYRRSGALDQLLAFRTEDFFDLNRRQKCLTFGVEHVPGLLDVCPPHGTYRGVDFVFPSQTSLSQLFLFHPPPVSSSSDAAAVQSSLLMDAPSSLISNWLDLLAERRTFFSPRVDRSIIDVMAHVDPSARLFWIASDDAVVAAVLLFNETQGRRYRTTERQGLMVERFRRSGLWDAKVGDILPIGITCLSVASKVDGVRHKKNLFEEVANYAFHSNLRCLLFRDEPVASFQHLSADVFSYERRVFVKHIPATIGDSLTQEIAKYGPTKMDSAFL